MAHMPSGIVTFLFTDIEGSTRLWEHEPDLMWAAVTRHNELLDEVIEGHRGVHFKTIGDAFQAAFASPVDALRAVVDAQRRFDVETWEGIGPLRVRMALHCGPAHPVDGDYLAPCLNRLSRMMSTGYGGQVLISDLIRRRVASSLPDGVSLRDLGSHRLRDLLEPERITQVVIDGLPDAFPPLKSLELHPTNLPIQPNPLVGREREIEEIMGMFRRDSIRLVTLTGIGGTGKTRLALQVGAEMLDEFQDGVYFIDLATVPDPANVVPAIAMDLGIPETTGSSLRDTLFAHLGDKSLLLMLDNFEHVLEAGSDVTGILERCPNVRILITSRAALRLRAEYARAIPPLEVPDPRDLPSLADLAEIDAVFLFVQRAMVADPGFELTEANAADVATICARLDGIPLAIELAAARIRAIPPGSLLERLDRRLEILTDGAQDLPERQRTLRATIEWSFDLLTPDAQTLFRLLAVFAGGFSLEAVGAMQEALGGPELDPLDGVTTLVDRSLVRRVDTPEGEPRYTMLETLREFGTGLLERDGGVDDVRDAHAGWCLALAETADGQLTGPEQSTWLERLELEHDNLRAALAWTEGRHDRNVRLATALVRFWLIHGHLTEGRHWVDAAITSFGGTPSDAVQIAAMTGSGHLAFAQGAFGAARERYARSLEAARSLHQERYEATLLNALGNVELAAGNLDEAKSLYSQSVHLSESLGDLHQRANALGNLGAVAHFQGETEEALSRYHECLRLWHELGNVQGTLIMLQNLLNLLAPFPEHADRARVYGEECFRLSRQLGDRQSEALTLSGLAIVSHVAGDYGTARSLHQQSLDLYTALNDADGIGRATTNLGLVALDEGDFARASDLLLTSLRIKIENGDPDGIAIDLEGLAGVTANQDKPEVAARILGAAERLRDEAHVTIPAEMVQRQERIVADLKKTLGERYKAGIALGHEMSIDELIEEVTRQFTSPASRSLSVLETALGQIDDLLPSATGPPSRPRSGTFHDGG